ncbi:MAG TPA: hypothetical protein VFU15_02195, partial [Bacteroidia bacterium]|nr:hypothetical protein [Bacteroidia bacterium]
YSGRMGKHFLSQNAFFVYAGTYLTLVLQLAFPLTIWFRKTRTVTMITGIVIHLLIIFLMGITDFGLIMIAAYSLFVKDGAAGKPAQSENPRAV